MSPNLHLSVVEVEGEVVEFDLFVVVEEAVELGFFVVGEVADGCSSSPRKPAR